MDHLRSCRYFTTLEPTSTWGLPGCFLSLWRAPNHVWRSFIKHLWWANLCKSFWILLVTFLFSLYCAGIYLTFSWLLSFDKNKGTECKKQYELLTVEKKPEVKPEVKKPETKPVKEEAKDAVPVIPPPAAPPPAIQRENSSSNSLDAAAGSEEHYYNTNGHLGTDGAFNFPPPAFNAPPQPTGDFSYSGWHQPFWNTSAASWIPQQPPPLEPINSGSNNNHLETDEVSRTKLEEQDSPPLDLDSRIELLLKGKMTAALNTPAFLLGQLDGDSSAGSSRSSSRAGDDRDLCSSPPLSPPPSPFLSQEIYLNYHKAAHPEVQGIFNYSLLVAPSFIQIYSFVCRQLQRRTTAARSSMMKWACRA